MVWDVTTRPERVEIEIIPGADILKVESILEGLESSEVHGRDVVTGGH